MYIGGDSVEQALIRRGETGAAEYFNRCLPIYRRAPYVHVWEGPNEPHPMWDAEFRRLLRVFTIRWTALMHGIGRRVGVGVWSVGWPDLGTAGEFADMMQNADYLVAHEYGAPTMQDKASYHCLRYRRTIQELRAAGSRIPTVLITELGIDGGVLSDSTAGRGWKSFAAREQYKSQLAWYDSEMCNDPEVACGLPFIAGPNADWLDFEIDEDLAQWIALRHKSLLGSIIGEAQHYVIPRSSGFALYEAARALGYYEASTEFDVDGNRVQVFRDPLRPDVQRIAYCRVGDWGNISWVTIDNVTHQVVA